jgi:tetratricopeptide (TPR) repeat protein
MSSQVCRALGPLRTVVASLQSAAEGHIPTGQERARVIRSVRSAGNAAVPTLIRALTSNTESESSWAYFLLARLGGERVVHRVGGLLEDPAVADDVKARALGLLSDLDAPVPQQVALRDPEALLARSVKDLIDGLDDEDDIEQAAELIMTQVPEPELPAFAAEVLRHGGRRATRLLERLCLHPALEPDTRTTLEELHRQSKTSRAERAAQETLERGLAYLEGGKPEAARRRLQRFVKAHPDQAEGRSALGVCLLQLDDYPGAMGHLHEAARLEPDEPLHRWNLAAAAKQADRLGGAYLALRDYLTLHDDGEGALERHKEARAFVRAYERMLRDTHPGVPLNDYLRGEELFARAYAALSEGRADDAVSGFEAVVDLVPRHYPSWGNLGAAYLAAGRRSEAQRCLERALQLNPDYAVARQNLQLLTERA